MARQSFALQVFVASPSDVSEERELMESVINQLNQTWSKNLGITYELLKWETSVRPTFSTDPQAAINEQIGSDYDVFIGIFWGRLGTSTPRANSGSVEEFQKALARRKATGDTPEIMLYFKDAPISPSKINIQQLEGVLEFKTSLSEMGGLYSVFEDHTGFESSLRAHLSAVAQSFASKQRALSLSTANDLNPVHPTANSITILEEDDYGYIDYLEIYEARQIEMTYAVNRISEATVLIGEQLTQRTAETEASTSGDAKDARRLFKRAADDMNAFADTMKSQLAILSTARETAFNALSNALALQGDFADKDRDLQVLQETLTALIDGTQSAGDGVQGMREATDSLPRVSREINKARRSVVHELDAFLLEVESTRSTVSNIIDSIDRIRQGR